VPIHEYKCSKCGKVFEIIQKINDEPLRRCKFCNGKVDLLISNSSFQLKGSGWYLTDYARKPESSTAPDSEAKAGEKAKPSEKPAESGPSTPAKAGKKAPKQE
jgi:putative FmdB family regulatory protein